MSSRKTIGNEASDDAQAVDVGLGVDLDEREPVGADEAVDEAVVEETPELRASVEQEIQATVDYADDRAHEGRLFGQTLEAQERMQAREWELERISAKAEFGTQEGREARTRTIVERGNTERREAFARRAGAVDRWQAPEEPDPREMLTREELGAVNREAKRLAERLDGWTRAAISRRLAERVVEGVDIASTVVGVYEELRTAPGQVIPIGALGSVPRGEVDVRGTVTTLWVPSHPRIQQVGLIEDESGRTKFTSWKRSRAPLVKEGDEVVLRAVAKSWYRGRCSVALTGRSRVEFPNRGRWWDA